MGASDLYAFFQPLFSNHRQKHRLATVNTVHFVAAGECFTAHQRAESGSLRQSHRFLNAFALRLACIQKLFIPFAILRAAFLFCRIHAAVSIFGA